MVKKLESRADTSKFTPEEKRIGYAITIANMVETGEVDKLVAKAKGGQSKPDKAKSQAKQAMADFGNIRFSSADVDNLVINTGFGTKRDNNAIG